MLSSMTGFSRASADENWGSLILEVSSVNSRYLEVTIHASRDLFGFEPLMQSVMRSKLERGKVQVKADLNLASTLLKGRLNVSVLRDYYIEVLNLQEKLGGPVPAVTDLFPLPGVTESAELVETLNDQIQPVLLRCLDQCVESLKKMRAIEGQAMEKDIRGNLNEYAHLIDAIAAKWKAVSVSFFSDYRARIAANIEQLGYTLDPGRLAQELVIQADKWDISEELTRSASHIHQFEVLLEKSEPVGRKIDFLLQEMNREINTIGSKAASTELRWLVVDGKTLLERIREQVQNVE